MKALKITVGVLVALFLLVTLVGFALPTSIDVSRSIDIRGTPQDIYPLIANFKDGWPEWSPFGKAEDPQLTMSFDGPALGTGARMNWDSPKMGEGHNVITKADPQHGIEMELGLMHDSFRIKGSLICEPAGSDTTHVTWTDHVEYGMNPYRRYFGLMVKKPLGREFDQGLAALKRKVEARVAAAAR